MRELLTAAAERAIRYLEDLNERSVAPDAAVVARLAQLAIPLPTDPSAAMACVARQKSLWSLARRPIPRCSSPWG
jgi:hypothetical protein